MIPMIQISCIQAFVNLALFYVISKPAIRLQDMKVNYSDPDLPDK